MAGRGYGMGQYRFNRDYDYIKEICKWESGSENIKYFSKDDFQDVFMILNDDDDDDRIKYEKSYYLHLEIPQHKEYALTLNLKMGRTVNDNNSPDMNHYQFIRELNILPSPNYSDKKISEKVILYALPSNNKITANIIDEGGRGDELDRSIIEKVLDNSGEKKYYENNDNENEITKYQIARIDKTWLYENAEDSSVTFDLVFSPKFSVSEPYNCLILELQRQSYDNEIQYISGGEPHKGVHLNKEKISGKLYEIDNLLVSTDANSNNSFSPSATINHIAVWSNPEFMFCINGEQIQIGQNNFYELNDFPITFFGVVVRKTEDGKNNFDDRFTVDYQYKLS